MSTIAPSGSHHMLLGVPSQLQIFAMYRSDSNLGVQVKRAHIITLAEQELDMAIDEPHET